MTIKDFLRIGRRRLPVIAAFTILVMLIYLCLFLMEKEKFQAFSKIRVRSSREFPYVSPRITESLQATWQRILTGEGTRTIAEDIIRQRGIEYTVTPDPGTDILIITGIGYSRQQAVDIANAIASASVVIARQEAEKELEINRETIKKDLQECLQKLELLTKRQREIENESRQKFGTPFIKLEFEMNFKKIKDTEDAIKSLSDKVEATRLFLEQQEKLAALMKHLQREILQPPTLGYHTMPVSTPAIDRINQELAALIASYKEKEKILTPDNPELEGLRDKISAKRQELYQESSRAMGYMLAREELEKIYEFDKSQIELWQKQRTLAMCQERHQQIEPLYQQYLKIDEEKKNLSERKDELTKAFDSLHLAKPLEVITQLAKARIEEAKTAGKRTANMLPLTLLIAIIIGLCAGYISELLDTSIKTDADVKRTLNVPTLCVVPYVKDGEIFIHKAGRDSILVEVFDSCATIIASIAQQKNIKSILVTSPNPKEGKTTIAVNLALALARQQKPVLLVDADMRIPQIHKILGLDNEDGIAEIFTEDVSLTDIEDERMGYLKKILQYPALRVITSGKKKEKQDVTITSEGLQRLLAYMTKYFDYIILDSPPVLKAGETLRIASATHAVLLTIRANRTDNREAIWAKQLLTKVNENFLGVVLNMTTAGPEVEYYYYRYYRYYYK